MSGTARAGVSASVTPNYIGLGGLQAFGLPKVFTGMPPTGAAGTVVAVTKSAGSASATARPGVTAEVTAAVDFFEAPHVLPRTKFDFGNIITQQTATYEVYNAYRNSEISVTGVVNNALPGVVLTGIAATPIVMPLQTALSSNVLTVLTEGLPTFDTSIDFTFSTGESGKLLVSGSRIILISQEYESPVKETLGFLTDIIEAIDGKEQRISLRNEPRQTFEVVYKLDGNDRQRMQSILMEWMDKVFGFPLQHEKLILKADVSATATQYQVSGADDVDLRVGGLAVIISDVNTFDVINISAKTDTLITASDPAVNGYSAGTPIYPLRAAHIIGAVAGARSPNNLETFKITFEVTDNETGVLVGDASSFSSYNGKVLFDDCNVVTGDMPEQFSRRIYRIDNQLGVTNIGSSWPTNKRSSRKGFVMRSRSEIMNFRKAMLAIRGRTKSFYIPTAIEDLTAVADLTSGAATMDIDRIDYEKFIKNREPKATFKITFTDGSSLVRTVSSSTSVNASTERLTLDGTWPTARTISEIVRIQFYEQARFDTDRIDITYPRIGLAESRLPVVQVF